ncbi:MAG: hypothetical protein ACTSUE_18375 [Promethearchaeota archaeon]
MAGKERKKVVAPCINASRDPGKFYWRRNRMAEGPSKYKDVQ